MARRPKLDNGLTPQWEKFARFYVAAFANITDDGSDIDIAVEAYRRAFNCHSDSKEKTHKDNARRLLGNSAIIARIEELRRELSVSAGIECAEIVSNNVKALRVDPLCLTIYDRKINRWRLRYMHEIPKNIRDVIPYKINSRGIVVPDVDRNVIQDRLIRMLGYDAPKEVNVKNSGNMFGELRIGFDDDDE